MRLLIVLLLLTATEVFAVSSPAALMAVDGQTLAVQASARELNRIRIEGGRITQFRGPNDRIHAEAVESSGEVYFRLVGGGATPFSLFVSADNGETYTLLVTPMQIPAVTVALRSASGASARPIAAGETTAPYVNRIKRLMRSMILDDARYHQVALNQPVQLGQRWQLILEKRWPGDLQGERYRLHNVSDQPLQLHERDLQTYLAWHQPSVLAVAIEQHHLQPGESTRVLLIQRSGRP